MEATQNASPAHSVAEVTAETQEASPVKWAAVVPAPPVAQPSPGSCVHINCGQFEMRVQPGISPELLSCVLRAVNDICC